MTPERHQQVKRLFLATVELPPPDAARYLREACGNDRTLRQEVESLLSHHSPETLLPAQGGEAVHISIPQCCRPKSQLLIEAPLPADEPK